MGTVPERSTPVIERKSEAMRDRNCAIALATGITCVVLYAGRVSAQAPGAAPGANPKVPAIVVSAPAVEVVHPPAYTDPKSDLSPVLQLGQKLFQQRCAVCHTPGKPTNRQVGPRLLKERVIGNEGPIREYIMSGGQNMPGFKDGLSASQINAIVEYLKTGLATPSVDQVGLPKSSGRGAEDINRRD